MSILPATDAAGIFGLSDEQFAHLSRIVKSHFGINLPPGKRVMLSMRMQKMMRTSGSTDFDTFYREQLRVPSAAVLSDLADHVSTNHTHFWREPEHFELYRDEVLPAALRRREQRGSTDLRVWCAAASSGEEPYTIAMIQREVIGARYGSWETGLLATDISTLALAEACAGVYPAGAVSRLPEGLRRRYFAEAEPGKLSVIDSVKRDVLFRRMNLVKKLPLRGDLDAIFCRNVMIYFDDATKRALVEQLYQLLAPGGVLFIGHAETLTKLGTPLQFWRPGVYRRR